MLWTMFVVLSLETINSRQFVATTDPLAGKLGKAGKGDTVPIPAPVGRYQTSAGGIGLAGVVVIGFDNDLRSKPQIRDGYAAAARALNQAIIDHFPKVRPGAHRGRRAGRDPAEIARRHRRRLPRT